MLYACFVDANCTSVQYHIEGAPFVLRLAKYLGFARRILHREALHKVFFQKSGRHSVGPAPTIAAALKLNRFTN
jgi:hypothetical protein